MVSVIGLKLPAVAIVGWELTPSVLTRFADGKTTNYYFPKWNPIDGLYVKCRWYRGKMKPAKNSCFSTECIFSNSLRYIRQLRNKNEDAVNEVFEWCEGGGWKNYTPTIHEVGCVLKLECVAVEESTEKEVGLVRILITLPVITR